jgi:ribosomal protein S27E
MGRVVTFSWEKPTKASPTTLTMSVIFDYEKPPTPSKKFSLVCSECGNDKFFPFPCLRKKCMRVDCTICGQALVMPQSFCNDFNNCGDCELKAECLGLPSFKLLEITHE